MKNEEIIRTALTIAGVVICVKYIVIPIVMVTATGIDNLTEQHRFNKRMKQGLKDGSIIKVDGQYYEVETAEED